MNYAQRLLEHDTYMQEAMLFLAARIGESAVGAMTDTDIGYTYGKLYSRGFNDGPYTLDDGRCL